MINEKDVLHVAAIAKISVTKKEVRMLLPELQEILRKFSLLNKAPTKQVHPSFHPVPIPEVYRKDKIEECIGQKILTHARHKKDGYFTGPVILE